MFEDGWRLDTFTNPTGRDDMEPLKITIDDLDNEIGRRHAPDAVAKMPR